MPDTVFLTVDQVIELHVLALTYGRGGVDGIRSHQQLAAAVMQPQQSAFGEDAYGTIAEKAAAYGYFLAEAQAFLDGNKRTGFLAMTTFLDLNGYELIEDEDEIAKMFEDLGSQSVDQREFFGWVVNHTRPKGSTGDQAG